ncbi:hypothetical protein DUI87_10701 [Hirundo rustica rustica]|uniref:ribonuclease H n=1 Tax=Hirundo rustica rustica TaxID=333673 RepID=A0A3M0KIU0_HIRRU|nr:hypothetical protein DUI87_10701 [Hirundo rustica rustica]
MGMGNFLLVPEADFNLLGRDLMVELGIGLEVRQGELGIKIFKLTLEDEQEINPEVWYTPETVGKLDISPFTVTLKDPDKPIRLKQYPMSLEGRRGLKPEVERLVSQGLLESCMSPFNTPILPVKKPNGTYRLVHDLREINKRTVSRFPVVANPYTLLSKLGPENMWYSVIDLKDAFWACPLDESCRDYFAFEWEDPDTGRKQQLRWTVLPQGFTESPNLFGQALEQILQDFVPAPGLTLIQYVDDLLIAGQTEEQVRKESIKLLNFLGLKGLKVSKSKLQFTEEKVKYLGHYIEKGEKMIDPERVQGILSLPTPGSKKQVRQLLGLLGYCRLWIENYSSKVKFLYAKLTASNRVIWEPKDEEQLQVIRKDLATAPVLSLPDLKRPFYLFMNIDNGTVYGVLTQEWAGKKKPIGYLSKLLDPVSRGWPTCLQAIVGCALMVEEARKITFNSTLKILSPHNVRNVLNQKAEKWISDARLLKYEGILLEAPNLTLETTSLQNPAQFLFGEPTQTEHLAHDCLQTIEEQTKIRPDLEEEELTDGEVMFVDGSSRVVEGKRKSGYAVVSGKTLEVLESGPLNPTWSAQACELYAILQALKRLEGKSGTIYTDSKYAYGVIHTFGKIWEERGLINSQGKDLIHQQLIKEVLQALRGPTRIAVVHIRGHQSGGGPDRYIRLGWPKHCKPTQVWQAGEADPDPGACTSILINVSSPQDPGWLLGKTWGVRLWETGKDRGGHFLIKKELPTVHGHGIGPNPVAKEEEEEGIDPIINGSSPSLKNSSLPNKNSSLPTPVNQEVPSLRTYSALWKIMQASFDVLNRTYPNLTRECWLCYDIRPPFYEAIGSSAKIRRSNSSNPTECQWVNRNITEEAPGITISKVTGNGTCIGTIPPAKSSLCNRTASPKGSQWLISAGNAKWVCMKTGISPCVSASILNKIKDFCVQVVIIPRVIYHPKGYVLEHQNTANHHLAKREPFTTLTLAVLLTLAGTGVGTGAAALITQPEKLSALRSSVDEDLRKIDESITALTNSVRSLSEVVLQNRRGLDLLFWQQGGLCVALKEECCTYVDKTGIVFDTLGELRKQIERREKERESYQNWYENWFNHSPWLTTLLSTIAGPVILLVLGLTFGPCIFNKLIEIVRGRLEAAHLLLVKAKYEALGDTEKEEDLEWSRKELERFNEQNKLT